MPQITQKLGVVLKGKQQKKASSSESKSKEQTDDTSPDSNDMELQRRKLELEKSELRLQLTEERKHAEWEWRMKLAEVQSENKILQSVKEKDDEITRAKVEVEKYKQEAEVKSSTTECSLLKQMLQQQQTITSEQRTREDSLRDKERQYWSAVSKPPYPFTHMSLHMHLV